MDITQRAQEAVDQGKITPKVHEIFLGLYRSYSGALAREGIDMGPHIPVFETLLKFLIEQIANPYQFEYYHHRITEPVNYYQFGLDFANPLIDKENSRVFHLDNLKKMQQQWAANENVILFSNHQTEVDPQIINICLEPHIHEMAANMIYVAGDRVITDPVAIPFSMGCNLLCIYSKRHIDHPPEKKLEKQQHNQRTMKVMRSLLAEGGKCVYVALSGGRDRANAQGEVEVSPFDPQSMEMFRLMAKQAKTPTHFYPLTIVSYDILPPPQKVESAVGEMRHTKRSRVILSFGEEIEMEDFPGAALVDRHTRRAERAHYIWEQVNSEYIRCTKNI